MKMTWLNVVAVAVLGLGSTLLRADDKSPYSGTTEAPTPSAASNQPNAMGAPVLGTEAASPLPMDWKKANGTVQALNPATHEVKLKSDKGILHQVTIDQTVTIKKDGKNVQFSELQAGDRITLTRKMTSGQLNNKG